MNGSYVHFELNGRKSVRSIPIISLILLISFFHSSLVSAQSTRISDEKVLETGRVLFTQHCASCHGNNAQSTVDNWQEPDANGKYPPPPLNGTAHTWHHPINALMQTVKNGTQRIGGSMPGFTAKLSDEEIFSIIVWLSSLWPEDIFNAWMVRNKQSQ